MDLRLVGETETTLTLGWEPPPGALGYRFSAEKMAKPSHTWDAARSRVRFAKGSAWYRVQALTQLAVGQYPPPSPPSGDLPDRSEQAWLAQTAGAQAITVTSAADLRAKLAALRPGQLLEASGFRVDGPLDIAARLSAPAYVHLGDVPISGEFSPWCTNVRLWGGEIVNPRGFGCRVTDSDGFQWWGGRIHGCGSTGFHVHGNVGANARLDIALEIWDCGRDLSFDPHVEKGSGLHAAYLGATDKGQASSGRFVFVVHDQPTGAACQVGNLLVNSELWVQADRISFVAEVQIGGNAIQFWGENRDVRVRYVEGNDLAGRVVNAIGTQAGIVVEKGRSRNVRLSPAYQPHPGISYVDCS